MIINIDLDGVMYDLVGKFQELYRGPSFTVTRWEFWHDMGISQDEWNATLDELILDGLFRDPFAFYAGVRETLTGLMESGHHVRIVSHKIFKNPRITGHAVADTAFALSRAQVPFSEIRFVSGPKRVHTAHVVIDDSPYVDAWSQVDAANILCDQPWNQWTEGTTNPIMRVTDITQASRIINTLRESDDA